MTAVLQFRTRVRADGSIYVSDPRLHAGDSLDVIILTTSESAGAQRSALDVIDEAEGQRAFGTAGEVEKYLDAERASWPD